MANYIASDSDLTAVANAIRTKGGTSAELEFPSGFVSAIAAIPSGGGGSLPSIISALAGGSFTPASAELCRDIKIQHNMSTTPYAFLIWSEDSFTEESSDNKSCYMTGYFSRCETVNNLQINVRGYNVRQYYRASDKRVSVNNGIVSLRDITRFVTESYLCMYSSNEYFQSGKTYKWLAWA